VSSGAAYDVVNPATEEVVTTVPPANVEDTDAAVARARRAFDTWRHVAPADRGRLLRRFAEQVDAHVEELARLEVQTPATRSATPAGRQETSATS
jgi:acyl-CoA reductase-like NAD-dependent aldehyde dehydrogenase